MIQLDQPLDLTDPEAPAFLQGLQGNILKGHGRDHSDHIFLRFGTDIAAARSWLSNFARERVTSAAQQLAQTRAWKITRGPGEPFVNLLLSYSGYRALGFPDERIPKESRSNYFELGMKRQSEAPRPFNDPPSTQWEAEYQGDVHALIIVAHDDPEALAQLTERILSEIAPFATAVWYERGARLQFQFPRGLLTIEHFGFEDGVSNPLFILQDIEKERASRGSQYWDPAAPLNMVLMSESDAQGKFGSFFVFRKLEQNVRGFKRALNDLAAQLGLSGTEAERAGAMAVGRFRDGAPIVSAPPAEQGNIGNDFTFLNSDPQGNVCPFQAHIRKTNPRGDTPLGVEGERAFRIARRGITYGERPDLKPGVSLPPPEHGVGLLFMSFQARLDQFAIQQEGSDSDDFARQGVGVDAVIGQSSRPVAQEWPQGSGQRFTIANFVMLKGGEYFFAPSMAFLYGLASADEGAAGA